MLLRYLRLSSNRLSFILNRHFQAPVATSSIPSISAAPSTFSPFDQKRFFAKSADRGGTKKIKGNIGDVTDLLDMEQIRSDMKSELDLLRDDYIQQVSVRMNLQAFERLVVKLPDNSEVPLNHLAQVTFKNPQLAIINLTASPHAVKSVNDALIISGLCGNPQIQTTNIYVPMTKPTREHREKLVQTAKLLYNRCHDRLRAVDQKYQLRLREYEKTAPKDEYKNAQMVLHGIMKEYAAKGEEIMKAKQKELMEEIK